MKRSASLGDGVNSPNPSTENFYLVLSSNDTHAKCLVCHTSIKKKTYNIKRHYALKHAKDYDSVLGDERKKLIDKLKSDLPNTLQEEEVNMCV